MYNVSDLREQLIQKIFKQGYFLLSQPGTSKYWVDMFSLSHLFNADEKHKEYYAILKRLISDVINHQIQKIGINPVICPRWTCTTDDLFSETLLKILFELHQENDDFKVLTIYELFIAGEAVESDKSENPSSAIIELKKKNSYYLNPVYEEDIGVTSVNALAFLALDIHFRLIQDLLKDIRESEGGNLTIESVISIIGRIRPDRQREFTMIPLFDAWNGGDPKSPPKDEFPFITDENSSLRREIFDSGNFNGERYIPPSFWP